MKRIPAQDGGSVRVRFEDRETGPVIHLVAVQETIDPNRTGLYLNLRQTDRLILVLQRERMKFVTDTNVLEQ